MVTFHVSLQMLFLLPWTDKLLVPCIRPWLIKLKMVHFKEMLAASPTCCSASPSVEEDASDETDLCSRFTLPVFQSLFNDVDGVQPLIFRLNNGDNAESKVSTFSITKKRPDGVYLLNIDGTTTTIGYLEAKPVTESKSWKKLTVDLVRLGLFAKNSIDTYNSNSVMIAQAIGADITFYLAEKKGEDVYLMLELHTITIPLTVEQMQAFYNQESMNKLLDIFVIFDTRCKTRSPT